jgi:Flp pilus assembly protein TadG
MTLSSKHPRAGSRGQSLVEFSLSALLLVLLMFGVFEISRMLLVFTTVANAARAGCRYAVVHGSDDAATSNQIKTLVKGYLSAAPMSFANATIAIGGTGGAGGNIGTTVSVTVTYPYDPWVGFYTGFFSINIASTSTGVITW